MLLLPPVQAMNADAPLLTRHYREGGTASYQMIARNQDGTKLAAYQAQADGVARTNARIRLSLENGKILSADMENPVKVLEKNCADETLQNCGTARRYRIERHVEIRLVKK